MATKKKTLKTTRDVEFNYIIQTKGENKKNYAITTMESYKASKKNNFERITLLGVEDGISKTGADINSHAAKNTTLKDLGRNVSIDTGLNDNVDVKIYGAPFREVLNNRQNYNNCGVESTLNTLAMAGIIKMKENLSDQKSVEKSFLKNVWTQGLVDDDGVIGKLDEADGGTTPDDYKDILRLYDIDSESYFIARNNDGTEYSDINKLGYMISQGNGAVVGVCSNRLWQGVKSETGKEQIDHAIAITGVVYKAGTEPSTTDNTGKITYNEPLGFYIHDSGAWMTRYISLKEFKEVTMYAEHGIEKYSDYEQYMEEIGETPISEEDFKKIYSSNLRSYDTQIREYLEKKPNGIFVTFTKESIKDDIFNLNATGDKQDNTITGNSGDNIIKGMAGKDTLYGNAGDDEIRGGAGNDIIVGNNVYETDLKVFKNYITDDKIKDSLTINTADKYQTGMNSLYGDAGDDVIIGGDDIDLIYGGAGNDYIWAGYGRNAVYGGAGKDVIVGGWENDRLFGEAGNDTIYGFGGDDTIHGGAGDDIIYGGIGNDKIETGKGNDTIYFEGTEHGVDTITSEGGHTTFKFIDEVYDSNSEPYSKGAKISDMVTIGLGKNGDNQKMMDFGIAYTNAENSVTDAIMYQNFFNTKTGKARALSIYDADGKLYNVTATKSKTATVSNTKTTGTTTIGGEKVYNADVNNILLTTNEKGTTITTSTKNDVVVMVGTDDKFNPYYKDSDVYDSVTYTGGNDRYVSEERDTHYYVNEFSNSTNLTIRDNVKALEKVVSVDKDFNPIIDKNVVSERDELYVNTASPSNLHFFFDVDKDKKTTMNDGLYILKNTDNFKNVITGDATGIITMDSFFKYDFGTGTAQEFSGTGFYGNGRIETIYYGEGPNYDNYNTLSDLSNDLIEIAGQVAGWLNNGTYNTGGYDNAFEAFNHFDELTGQAQTALVGAYSLNS